MTIIETGVYLVTFEDGRIGRSHDVAPFEVHADSADGLAEAIYSSAQKRLGSREVEVVVDLEEARGHVAVGGFRIVGRFTLAAADHQPGPAPLTEPPRMGAIVRDRDGDTWRRGRTRWSCEAPVDGQRIGQVGRLRWDALVSMYGPLTVVDLNDRKATR